MTESYFKQDRYELLFQEKLVMTKEREGISQCLLITLPGNADLALIYIKLIKHDGALLIWSVLTTTTS